ncbi:tripartite tricarboxylate transporter TctB family protein [Marinomonas sp. A79]|uniref:Tripartite tricarboxylate transporter TctB family protein n=1 Tax=Marinomonas vulgaris TaxID=2823372 RepID=A0ABS5HEP8_9GAMM|nr:tripartite tricarboxylate transporter TctB family protein [Marinomonas vulgaris]MBR7890112.1 tripartite tricarboxylate transporter TctB family protein [Marinomonas vulgaris]
MNVKNIILPSVIIVISLVALYFISQFAVPSFQDASVGSKFFPTAIAVIQIIICVCIILGEIFHKDPQQDSAPLFNKYSIFGAVFIIGYATAIYFLGYLAATLLAFFLYLVFFKTTKRYYYLIAIVFTLVIYYVFANVFYVALPEGLFAGLFYD